MDLLWSFCTSMLTLDKAKPSIHQGNGTRTMSMTSPSRLLEGCSTSSPMMGMLSPPISIRDGLPYVALHPFTDEERDSLLHVILSGDADWDPGVLDLDLDDNYT